MNNLTQQPPEVNMGFKQYRQQEADIRSKLRPRKVHFALAVKDVVITVVIASGAAHALTYVWGWIF